MPTSRACSPFRSALENWLPADGEAVVEALAKNFHAALLLRQLNPGKDLGRGQTIVVEHRGVRPGKARKSSRRSDSTITAVDASGKTIAHFPASTGSEHDPRLWQLESNGPRKPGVPLQPEALLGRSAAHQGPVPAGPNNPVGVSGSIVQGTHGIHGTPEPSRSARRSRMAVSG